MKPLTLVGLFALAATTAVRAQTAYPTPVDTNGNGKIDSAEIQAVIDSVTSGIIYLPASQTYNIDSPLSVTKDNVTLLGEGHGTSGGGGTLLVIAGNIEGVVISGCTGSGLSHLNVAASSSHATNAVRLSGATNAFLQDVRITNAYRGVEIVNCSSPVLTDVSMKGHAGDYGLRIWGNGGTTTDVQITRINTGAASGNTVVEWMIVGPSVNGLTLQSSRFVGGYRGMRLTGSPGPTAVSTVRFGSDNALGEAVLVESGSGLTMVNSWIGQPNGSGVVLGTGFGGTASFTNLRIRGAYAHGLEIDGGNGIRIWNPLIGANGTDPAGSATTIAGIHIDASVSDLRVTGGRVGPLYSQGSSAKQYYGIHFAGTAAQSDAQDVKSKGSSLAGNAVPYAPANLPTN